jgi:hypothetical protein
MAKTVELSLTDEMHDALTKRAVKEGVSVGDLVVRELEHLVQPSDVSAVLQRILSRDPVNLGVPAADLVREGRDERAAELSDRWSSMPRR